MDIKALQRDLLVISGSYRTTGVYPSGVYDSLTRKAFDEVRELLGCKKEEPAEAIRRISLFADRLLTGRRAHGLTVLEGGRVYALGDRADAVAVGQIMINRISQKYPNVPAVTVNGVMDAATVRAIGILRGIFGHHGTQLDAETWMGLTALYYSVHSGMIAGRASG